MSFSNSFELSPSIIAIIDIKKLTFNKLNSAFVEILGYNKEKLIGKTIDEICSISNISEKIILLNV